MSETKIINNTFTRTPRYSRVEHALIDGNRVYRISGSDDTFRKLKCAVVHHPGWVKTKTSISTSGRLYAMYLGHRTALMPVN